MLLIDIGNTRIKWGVWHSDVLDATGVDAYRTQGLESLLQQWFGEMPRQASVVVSGVSGDSVRHIVANWFRRHWDQRVEFVQVKQQQLGVINSYKNVEQMAYRK